MDAFDFGQLSVSGRKIIVGIDFGTTYSGVAWAETQRPDRRTAITTWPISKTIREGESSDKVPTKLRYAGDEIQWGFSIPVTAPQDEVVEWFKLDLDPSLQSMGQAVSSEARGGRNVDKLVTDYISALGNHLIYTLKEKLGEQVVNTTPLEFVVTVPAIWSDLAKDKTKQACQRAAGLNTVTNTVAPIHLVSEPEAAAIYALHGLDPHGLKVDDTVVVVDAGGGTVDLISYTITSLKPILEVQEAAPGSGALCGSTFLNMRFAKFLKAKLGKEDGFDDEIMAEAMEHAQVKRQFTLGAAPDDTYTIPVGGLANNKELGINRGRFALKASDLQTIFEPVVLECIKLVKDQITASNVPIRAILLVGGFGASNYLKERLRNAIDKSIQIMQPPNAWQAVVQGAVMKGLAQVSPDKLTQVKVQNRKARKHYGTEWRSKYDAKLHKHLEHKRHWCGLDGCYKVYTMEWFIQRGDNVSENEPFYTSFVWTGLVSQGRIKKIKMDIYADRNQRIAPVARDENVSMLVHVEADVGHIPEHMLSRRQGLDGQWYYELNCKIEAVYLSASTTYTLLYNNQRYNTVTADPNNQRHHCAVEGRGDDAAHRNDGDEHTVAGWLTVAGSFLVYFVSFGYMNSFGYFQDYYLGYSLGGYPSSVIAIIGSLQLGLMNLIQPVAGGLADSYSPSILYAIAAVGAIVSSVGVSFAQPGHIWQFILTQGVIFGSTAVFGTAVSLPLASQHFTRRRALAIGIVASGSSAGGVCLPIMFSHLVPRIGFGWALRIAALIALVCYGIAILISRPKLPRKPVKSIWSIVDFNGFRDPQYSTLAFANVVGNFGLYVPFYYLEPYIAVHHPGAAVRNYLLPLINGSSFFGRVIGGYVADHTGGLNLLYPLTAISGILCLTLWLLSTSVSMIVAFACLYGFCSGIFISVTPSVTVRLSPTDKVGARLGAFSIWSTIGVFTGTPIGGAFVRQGTPEEYQHLIIFTGMCLTASAVLQFATRILCDRDLRKKW
ncbi:Hsp70-like protein [Colletotrichum scovillei]|uniref:Hsp70-like protein n=1 Tax=Colletotrichum scovillei TaxID=1209932 RepID=A0A9P7RBL6_9PEZI|nr:Hsp70-like protein [Colletotrichum scovillei]